MQASLSAIARAKTMRGTPLIRGGLNDGFFRCSVHAQNPFVAPSWLAWFRTLDQLERLGTSARCTARVPAHCRTQPRSQIHRLRDDRSWNIGPDISVAAASAYPS